MDGRGMEEQLHRLRVGDENEAASEPDPQKRAAALRRELDGVRRLNATIDTMNSSLVSGMHNLEVDIRKAAHC